MTRRNLPAALPRRPVPADPAEIQRRSFGRLSRLSRLSPQDPAEAAQKHQADSLRRLALSLEMQSNRRTTPEQ